MDFYRVKIKIWDLRFEIITLEYLYQYLYQYLYRYLCSSPRIFEPKRDCSQSRPVYSEPDLITQWRLASIYIVKQTIILIIMRLNFGTHYEQWHGEFSLPTDTGGGTPITFSCRATAADEGNVRASLWSASILIRPNSPGLNPRWRLEHKKALLNKLDVRSHGKQTHSW